MGSPSARPLRQSRVRDGGVETHRRLSASGSLSTGDAGPELLLGGWRRPATGARRVSRGSSGSPRRRRVSRYDSPLSSLLWGLLFGFSHPDAACLAFPCGLVAPALTCSSSCCPCSGLALVLGGALRSPAPRGRAGAALDGTLLRRDKPKPRSRCEGETRSPVSAGGEAGSVLELRQKPLETPKAAWFLRDRGRPCSSELLGFRAGDR